MTSWQVVEGECFINLIQIVHLSLLMPFSAGRHALVCWWCVWYNSYRLKPHHWRVRDEYRSAASLS
jgi:hypothetical protein